MTNWLHPAAAYATHQEQDRERRDAQACEAKRISQWRASRERDHGITQVLLPERAQQGRQLEVTFYTSKVKEAEEFGVGVFNLQPGQAFDLGGAVNGSAAAVMGRVEGATPTKVQGFDAARSSRR